MKKIFLIYFAVVFCFLAPRISAQIPVKTLVQISRAEDELRFDKTLADLMKSGDARVRARAALAAGRIGKEYAIAVLIDLLEKDSDADVRQTAAFALGEIESIKAADALLRVLQNSQSAGEIRARAVEAAGKIAAANAKDEKSKPLGAAILDALQFEITRGAKQNRSLVLLGITAILRAKPEGGDAVAAKFLTNADGRIRADAANTLSRLRSKITNEKLRAMLISDKDPIARANAARALGAAEDASAFNNLLNAAVSDTDLRVRVSAIRSLGTLKDAKAADKLLERGEKLLADGKKSKFNNPVEKNELLEIAATIGKVLEKSDNQRAVRFFRLFRVVIGVQAESEIAFVRVAPEEFSVLAEQEKVNNNGWEDYNNLVQAFGEYASLLEAESKQWMIDELKETLVKSKNNPKSFGNSFYIALPETLRAYAKFKTDDLAVVLRDNLKYQEAVVRAAAAELLGEQPTNKENVEALKTAFDKSLSTDKQLNDAQLAILDALFKLDKNQAAPTLLAALNATDYLVRKKAFELLKDKDVQKMDSVKAAIGNFTAKKKNQVLPRVSGSKLGQILNTQADYVRAVSRKAPRAILKTEKGTFTIEFFPEDAPLTVDNFIKLARAKYFNGLAIHRVVPNFVMQDGDPRGDGNGGPGWEIRDEMNVKPFERGTVGMALSGKDTGGSQWFVCHSPQPHLDGGYTVFGRVSETDMKVVDNLARGDKILSVRIVEGN